MVTKYDVMELGARLKRLGSNNISRIRGCYVNAEKEIVARIDERFADIGEEEIHKYLDIAKEPFKPKEMDNRVLTLEFDSDSERIRAILTDLVRSELKNESAAEELYAEIIENYEHTGNFLILLYTDTYDIIRRTKDGKELDESEEVYTYIICAICPVGLQQDALQYEKAVKTFKALNRQWVVGRVSNAFVYPAFDNRSADWDEVMYYCSHPGYPGHEVIENILKCKKINTASEHKGMFEDSLYRATESEIITQSFKEGINAVFEDLLLEEDVNCHVEPVRLNADELMSALQNGGMEDYLAEKVAEDYKNRYQGKEYPKVRWLYDKKARNSYYAKQEKNHIRELLEKAGTDLYAKGNKDLAQEIEEYLIKTK